MDMPSVTEHCTLPVTRERPEGKKVFCQVKNDVRYTDALLDVRLLAQLVP